MWVSPADPRPQAWPRASSLGLDWLPPGVLVLPRDLSRPFGFSSLPSPLLATVPASPPVDHRVFGKRQPPCRRSGGRAGLQCRQPPAHLGVSATLSPPCSRSHPCPSPGPHLQGSRRPQSPRPGRPTPSVRPHLSHPGLASLPPCQAFFSPPSMTRAPPLSLPLCLSVSASLSLRLCLCVSVSLSPSLCLCLSLHLCVTVSLCVSVFLSLPLSPSMRLSVSVSVTVSLCLSISVPVSLSHLCLSLCLLLCLRNLFIAKATLQQCHGERLKDRSLLPALGREHSGWSSLFFLFSLGLGQRRGG